MKQQDKLRHLHMGCGESLTVSQTNRLGGLQRKVAATQKPGKVKPSKGETEQ